MVEARHFREPDRGLRNLRALEGMIPAECWPATLGALEESLPRTPDPDMALNNLERFFTQPAALDRLPALLERQGHGLAALLQLLATSQFFADTLTADPECLNFILHPTLRNPSINELKQRLRAELESATDDSSLLRILRRFRRRQMLRIGINDVIRDRPLEEITRDLAHVADALIDAALTAAWKTAARKFGEPQRGDGEPARLVALAFGKLGGDELNYSSDIDLMFVYDEDGETTGKRARVVPNSEFFSRVITDLIRLLSSPTADGFVYRVDLRLRPEGAHGPLARSLSSTLSYYDVMGRTWERQALIKLRPVAGDPTLGQQFVQAIEPFIYRKYFSFSEINEVKALKRKMEQRATRTGVDDRDVKTGRGGIRDIEYTVQFLQLLNGGDLQAVRQRNTLIALEALEIAGCLTSQETYILADAYRFLRRTEHRLQLLFDMQTHKIPQDVEALRTLALRMGYTHRGEERTRGDTLELSMPTLPSTPAMLSPQRRSPLDEAPPPWTLQTRDLLVDPLDHFLKDLHDKTRLDRTILDHLLHQTFADAGTDSDPESDLILQSEPDEANARAILVRYGFRDIPKAMQNLSQLAREAVPFLSHRRCRHFLASIAPQLLRAVADTSDPDEALTNLEQVTASLGAKAVLYELFSANPPTLKLYVDLCASSPFLSGLLMNNPGMIDELLDSLVLDQSRTLDELKIELTELCRGASDLDPILHSFQDKELLRLGVRDLLGKDTIRETTAGLSDLAEAVLCAVVDLQEPLLRRRYGVPVITNDDGTSARPCRYALIGLGKLGGREISYHSDLDLMLIFEADGQTVCARPEDTIEATTNFHYFTELMQKVIKAVTRMGPLGRLYAVDMRLRPTGKSGSLVLPLTEFTRYFAEGGCQIWERQALTRARVVGGDAAFARDVQQAFHQAILGVDWCPAAAREIRTMRTRLESTASKRSLKRGTGGLVDIEFIVQMLQLQHGRTHPEILQSNIWVALETLVRTGILAPEIGRALLAGYSYLRGVEARLRIVTDRPLTEIPEGADDCVKLARRLGMSSCEAFTSQLHEKKTTIRQYFSRLMDEASADPA